MQLIIIQFIEFIIKNELAFLARINGLRKASLSLK